MFNMTQINLIRDLAKSGYRISEIHEMTKADPKTINKYLEKNDFSPEPPIKKDRRSIVAPFRDKIIEWLEDDKDEWPKQRHTAKRVFERLRDEEGYKGSYDLQNTGRGSGRTMFWRGSTGKSSAGPKSSELSRMANQP